MQASCGRYRGSVARRRHDVVGILAECVGIHQGVTARSTTWKKLTLVLRRRLVNPSIATISIRSHATCRAEEASQVLNLLERPGTRPEREGPLRSRMGVTSKMTVTYFVSVRVWRRVFIHADDSHAFKPGRM